MSQRFSSATQRIADFWKIPGSISDVSEKGNWTLSGKTPTLRRDFDLSALPTAFTMEIDFVPGSAVAMVVEFTPFFVWLNDPRQPACISQSLLGNALVQNRAMKVLTGAPNALRVRRVQGRIDLELNGEQLTFASQYAPAFDHISLKWLGDAAIEITRLEFHALDVVAHETPPRREHFEWQMTVDFYDDLIPAPCSSAMLDEMMKRLADQGYQQVNWIFHGDAQDGFWDSTGGKARPDEHIVQTREALGESDLKAAVAAAHKFGLRLHAVFKPFDLSICGFNFPLRSPLAEKYGKNQVLGGNAYMCFNFAAEHPELCMRRRGLPAKGAVSITRIAVSLSDGSADPPAGLELWISDDNWKYRRCEAPLNLRSSQSGFEIVDLRLTSPFFAIRLPGNEGKFRFHNALPRLIRIYSQHGDEIPFTYGLCPRTYWQPAVEASPHLGRTGNPGGGFANEGFFFDSLHAGIPSSLWSGNKAEGYEIALDNPDGVIGIAIGKNEFVPGVMCPSEPAARAFWKSLITRALDYGVDGVNLRVANHADIIEWKEYGFNAPMVEAYRRRYGVDALCGRLEMDKWRELRGEFYTLFLSEARDTIKARGKSFAIHISDLMQGSADASSMMEIHWDWERWIRELRPDQVTMKLIGEESYHSHHCREVVRQCALSGIPVILCPFVHSVQNRIGSKWAEYFEELKLLGLSGFDVYENATCYVNRKDGTVDQLMDFSSHIASTHHSAL